MIRRQVGMCNAEVVFVFGMGLSELRITGSWIFSLGPICNWQKEVDISS